MTGLLLKLRKEIEQNGPIPFARFMEWALYSPDEGYYERPLQIGKCGDFYTSVSVGPMFGELLAFQFAQWFEAAAKVGSGKLQIIEAGAHDGKLAGDILHWFQQHSSGFKKLEYCFIEPSHIRQNWQKETVKNFQNVKWTVNFSELLSEKEDAYRIIFSNELFDAMPAHRIGWDAKTKTWFEWNVGLEGDRFVWSRENQRKTVAFPDIAPELMDVLPDDFTTEVCPAATEWWTQAAHVLSAGKIIAIDYGLLAEEFFVPERRNGTLRAFSQHHANLDLLARPGEQDLTAHVNFSALKDVGEAAGLKTEALISQTKFLTGIAERIWREPSMFSEWDANRRRQFQTLIHPEHLGRGFRVLIQSR